MSFRLNVYFTHKKKVIDLGIWHCSIDEFELGPSLGRQAEEDRLLIFFLTTIPTTDIWPVNSVGMQTVQAQLVLEYGVTFLEGRHKGKTVAPLTTEGICNYNRNYMASNPRLVVRKRWVFDEIDGDWELADDEQVDHWNKKIMAPYTLHKRDNY